MNEKGVSPQKPNVFKGLCQSCEFAENCKLQDKSKTVFQCEEFELINTLKKTATDEKPTKTIIVNKETHTGLCKNCLKRKDCIYTSPVSVIWHCEEYE